MTKHRDRDTVRPPLTLAPDRQAEADGLLVCYRCGREAHWCPIGDAFLPACVEHASEDDWT